MESREGGRDVGGWKGRHAFGACNKDISNGSHMQIWMHITEPLYAEMILSFQTVPRSCCGSLSNSKRR